MNNYKYQKICQELLKELPQKQKDVISRRFGLNNGRKETLEQIGQDFNITRERVRQIEEDGLLKIKPKIASYKNVFQHFNQYFKKHGGLKKEEILLEDLGEKKHQAHIYLLLNINEQFKKFSESANFYSFWTTDENSPESVEKNIDNIINKLKEANKPLSLKELISFCNNKFLASYLEISKRILKNSDGLYGLREWPEINPKGVKDKAYLVFKKLKKPLHFNEIAGMIDGALSQTVHNELIKDSRFVLIGRGIYALKEWGYESGQVKDVISRVLKESGPLTQGEILEKVLKQRLVKENTILLNLSNKKNFLKDSEGRYKVSEI